MPKIIQFTKTKEEKKEEYDFEETIKRNKEKKDRLQEERKKNNRTVKRDYRLDR